MVQIGIDRHLLTGHRVEGKACRNLRHALRALRDNDEVDNDENDEHDEPDHGIAADNKVAKRSNDLTGIAVEEDQSRRRYVQCQSEQCRNEEQGGEDRQVKCLHIVDCRHHDKQCNRNIQTDKNVKQDRRQRNNHHDDDCHDGDGDQNITVSLYEITGCKGIYTAGLRCCHALITPSFPWGRTDSSSPSILYQIS